MESGREKKRFIWTGCAHRRVDGVRDCVGSSVPALVGAFNCSRALAAAARAARRGGGTPLKSSNSIKNYREFLKVPK